MKSLLIFFLINITGQLSSQEFYWRQLPSEYNRDIQKITMLYQSADHMIWMGTDKGLFNFDGRNYKDVPRSDGQLPAVSAISESPSGEIWVGYADGVIQIVRAPGAGTMIREDSLMTFPISKILFHSDGKVFITTYGHGVWIWEKNQLTRPSILSNELTNDVYDALLDPSHQMWLATDHGIWMYNPASPEKFKNFNKQHGLTDEIVTKLLAEKSGDIWLGCYDQGIGRYSVGLDTVITIIQPNRANGPVTSMSAGFGNEIWYANEKDIGRYSFDLEHRTIALPVEIEERINAVLFDRTGNLWMARGNKVYMANTQFEHIIPGVEAIQSITPTRDDVWLGCEDGLYSLDRRTQKLTAHLPDLHLNILSIYIDIEGLLWIGTFGKGLYIYNSYTRQVKNVNELHGLSNNSILNIDGKGQTLWLTTLGGITQINWMNDPVKENLRITKFQEKFDMPAGYVYDVYVGNDDAVWFGTDGKGLYCLEQDKMREVGNQILTVGGDSIDIRTIYSITSDKENNIWISATQGNILKLNRTGELLERIESKHGSINSLITTGQNDMIIVREGAIEIKNPFSGLYAFTSAMGLQSFSPNINSTARDKDGSVWIAGTDEILHFTSIPSDTSRYVHMHLVDPDPGMQREEQVIKLRPDSNFLDLRFTGLWYTDPNVVRYRYKLEGHDQDWIYTQEGRVVYSKLSPGTYTFYVAGSYNDDFSKSKSLQRTIVVLPPFYLTWWFISGLVFLILLFTYLIIRARIRHLNKLHQLEREKTNLQLNAIRAQVNPHFLFNSFNTLSSIIEEDQKSAVDYVDQLSGFFRGVIKHRDAELITIQEEITIMHNYIYILKKRHEEKIHIEQHITPSDGYIAPMTIQLLLENAIKHNKITDENPLRISIAINAREVIVTNPIRPKIQGMTESTGFGLSSLLTRYQYLTHERVEIVNDGNTFTVRIPIIHPNEPL